jgi:hypothetical protein
MAGPSTNSKSGSASSLGFYSVSSGVLKCTCLLQLEPMEAAQKDYQRWPSNSVGTTECIPKDQK